MSVKGFSGNSQTYLGYDTDILVKIRKSGGRLLVSKDPETHIRIESDDKKSWWEEVSYRYAKRKKAGWLRSMLFSPYDIFIGLMALLLIFSFVFRSGDLVFLGCFLGILSVNIGIFNIFAFKMKEKKLFFPSLIVGFMGFFFDFRYWLYGVFSKDRWE